MPLDPAEREEKERPLAQAGLSTRDIERITGIPQSTVVRDLKRINTGPQPILGHQPARHSARRISRATVRLITTLLIITLLCLTTTFSALAWMRTRNLPAPAPAPAAPAATSISLCVGITLQGYVSDLAQAQSGHCPIGWKLLVLKP